ERQYGYGGYKYDGRWLPIAQAMASHYGLKPGDRILDVCCGKGFLLHEFTNAVPGVEIAGIDISDYAVANAKEEVKPALQVGNAISLPYPDKSFDFVVSLGGLHNLPIRHLFDAVREIDRVGKGSKKYIMVESFRNERERANLLYWQLTCESFHDVKNWEWIYEQCGYQGDWGFIFFE
ncbi:MAG TPA: class I SAM-dependent methyltransferase, partial [Reyranella sp.]|nr:class I SAM-dependent methyltransferase [Reyranella sp.]